MKKISLKLLVLVLSCPFVSINVFAIENQGAISGGLGGAGVGAVEAVDGTFMNPASIAFFEDPSFAISHSADHLNAHFTDNGKEALFPAALGYKKKESTIYTTQSYHLIFAYKVAKPLSLGADISRREIKISGINWKAKQTVYNVGATYLAARQLILGVVFKNKESKGTILPNVLDENSSWVLGATYIYDSFANFKFDIERPDHLPEERYIYKFGLETSLNDWIVTRIGYQNDNAYSLNYFTAGLGFMGPQFGLNYAYQSESENNLDPIHVIDLSIPF